MKKYIFSDLIMENAAIKNTSCGNIDPDEYSCEWKSGIEICKLNIKNGEASKRYSCAVGSYVTVYTDRLDRYDTFERDTISDIVADEIRALTQKNCAKRDINSLSVLIAGMGNREITPDALGARTVDLVRVTRHMQKFHPDYSNEVSTITAVACGVLGKTGIESFELLKGIIDQIHPQLLIAVDALAAKSSSRVASVIQISDTGISPGSGVGNKLTEINQKTVGIPVIALGIPTVVSAATLVADALNDAGIQVVDKKMRGVLENYREMFVSPKECDLIVKSSAELLARAIEKAFL